MWPVLLGMMLGTAGVERGAIIAPKVKAAAQSPRATEAGVTTMSSEAAPFQVYRAKQAETLEAMLAALGTADVVFVGENHDHKQGHVLELEILTRLYAQNPRLALSLEMFERDVQGVLDEYLGGWITESAFLQASRPWPNYKDDYRPLIEFCHVHKIPVIAANAPRRYVNLVSRKGQEALLGLPRPSRTFLPALPYATDTPAGYEAALDAIFGMAHESGGTAAKEMKETKGAGQTGANAGTAPSPKAPGETGASRTGETPLLPTSPAPPTSPSAAHLKESQWLWDATMADSILRFQRTHRGVQVLQINGAMHSDQGWGIVDRLRKAAPRLRVATITIRPDAAYPNPPANTFQGLADWILLTPQP